MPDRLVVAAPPSFAPERRYAMDVVLRDWLGLEWVLRTEDRSDVRITLEGETGRRAVIVPDMLLSGSREAWLTPRTLPLLPLPVTHVGDADEAVRQSVPVIFGTVADGGPFFRRAEDEVTLACDVFGSVFFLLTRYEERVGAARDEHGRFPDREMLLVRARLHHRPLADEYADLLRSAIRSLWPGIALKTRAYRVTMSHDVDLPLSCRQPVAATVRTAAADFLRRRDPALAARRLATRIACGDHSQDPWNVFDFLMDVSEANGIQSVFNFLADTAGPGNGRYTLEDPFVRRLISRVHERGHEIGLHGGYESHENDVRLARELDALRAAAEGVGVRQERWGGRQHFLRWSPRSWRAWDEAGLAYDSTVGFASHVGFRAGTSRRYRTFDLDERRPLGLEERPMTAMDIAFLHYNHRLPLAAVAEHVLDVARAASRSGGEFVALWHNSSVVSSAQKRFYAELVPLLVRA